MACLAAASCVLRLLTSWLRDGGDSDRLEATRKIIRVSVDEGETIVHLQADPRCPHCSEDLEAGSRWSEANSVHLRKLCGAGSIETWLKLDLDEVEVRLRRFDTTLQIERGSVSVRAKDEHGALICYRNGRALLTGNHAQHLETARALLEGWLGDDALVRL